MGGKLAWHGEKVRASIRSEMKRRINRCCILVYNRAKELINKDGTGIARETAAEAGKRHGRERVKKLKASVREHNEAHKLGIGLGKIKKLRVTKAGTVSDRRKPRKKK